MNYVFRLLFILLFLSSCAKEVPLAFKSEVFSQDELELCKNDPCSTIAVEYAVAQGDSEVAKRINDRIEYYVIASLFLGDDDEPSAKTIEEAATDFIMAYRDHQPDLPQELDFGGYDAEVTIHSAYKNESIISLEHYAYLFTGGAHGYGSSAFLLFDLSTGEEIDPASLFSDLDGFTDFAEQRFKATYNIPKEDNINSTGFWFEDDAFYLPTTMGFTEDLFVIIYNQYEIASYAAGPIRVEIPLEQVQPYMDQTYL